VPLSYLISHVVVVVHISIVRLHEIINQKKKKKKRLHEIKMCQCGGLYDCIVSSSANPPRHKNRKSTPRV
jgi:hypothetical protein